jgi:hypothetical protein
MEHPLTTPVPQLTTQELRRFETDGYAIVRHLLDDELHLEPIRRAMGQAVDLQAREWLEQGLVNDLCDGEPFEKRYGELRRQFPATVSNSWRRMLVSREIYDVWQYPPLIGIIRQLLGDELYASSIWNGRPRAPDQLVQTIDWHQDAQYMQQYDSIRDHAISVWLPLVPVDERSGCLQVIPGSHKKGFKPEIRVPRNNLLGLAEGDLDAAEPVTCVMEPGDALLFTELLHHRSVDNLSDYTRWSLDVRYFDACNEELSAKEKERYRGSGYYCHSSSDSRRVESYDAWAASYDYEGEF